MRCEKRWAEMESGKVGSGSESGWVVRRSGSVVTGNADRQNDPVDGECADNSLDLPRSRSQKENIEGRIVDWEQDKGLA